ncbi:MAG: histidinol dehydrogenase, partial [Candidatus Margulisbacteria bacterium]|nr:histidinol dehydrogenase [Candidatus Margulisiibacteriota bacterium]
AGVEEIVMVTPPKSDGSIDPTVLAAASLCGIHDVFKIGGAQAIFALAYGTETIPKVDKIVGPGNKFVTAAKQQVFGTVDIDKIAGPSEVLVYIQEEKYAEYAAADLLAQLEHDPDARVVGVSENRKVLEAVQKECLKQVQVLERKEIIHSAAKHSVLLCTSSESESISIINEVASEHVVIMMENWEPILEKIKHGGSIFCGPYTPVTLGDYVAGPNHVLPTNGTARYASPLGVMDFMKYSSFLTYKQERLQDVKRPIQLLTAIEKFDAHYAAFEKRLHP